MAATYKPQYRCSNCGFTDSVYYLSDSTARTRERQAAVERAKLSIAKSAQYRATAATSEGWRKIFYQFLAFEYSTHIMVGTAIAFLICVLSIAVSLTKTSPTQSVQNSPQTYSTPRPAPQSYSSPAQTYTMPPKAIKTPKPKTNNSTKGAAVVISENVNLRVSPDSTSEIVDVLANGSTVQVIKQKGAWFYVSSGLNEGWLHGNTIRLQ